MLHAHPAGAPVPGGGVGELARADVADGLLGLLELLRPARCCGAKQTWPGRSKLNAFWGEMYMRFDEKYPSVCFHTFNLSIF